MQFSVLALAALVASVSAAAIPVKLELEVEVAISAIALKGDWKGEKNYPLYFTSAYEVTATPDEVVDANNAFTGGLDGAEGSFRYGINKDSDVICYHITLQGFQGEYQSPAATATHIHQGLPGKAGPPRIAFPNPVDNGKGVRVSKGCIQGPFKTGLPVNGAAGTDTGDGFKLAELEKSPNGFFTDTHSSLAVPGAVRGQLKW